MQRLQRFLCVFWLAAKRFYTENFTYNASALAFTTLLALVPLLSVILSFVAIFPIFSKFMALAQHYVVTYFLPSLGGTLQNYLTSFTAQATRLPIIGIVFLVFSAMTLIITVENTFDAIWQVPQRKKKFSVWLIYWSILILAPLAIGFSVFLSSLFLSLSWFANSKLQFFLQPSVLMLLSLAINTTLFSLLYIILPNTRIKLWQGLTGGFVASGLYEIVRKLFSFYVHQFPTYELIYGTLSIIPIFILWVYVSWMIVLYGALVTHQLCKHKR